MNNVNTGLDEHISISLPKGTLLVLLEFLGHGYEQGRRSGSEEPFENSFQPTQPDDAERVALWHLECAIERTLPEIFAPGYKALIAAWKQKLTSE